MPGASFDDYTVMIDGVSAEIFNVTEKRLFAFVPNRRPSGTTIVSIRK